MPDRAGNEIELLVACIQSLPNPEVRTMVEDLTRAVMDLHRRGLARAIAIVAEGVGGGDGPVLDRLASDPEVGQLLALHDLHPLPLATRVERALAAARPALLAHGGDVKVLEIDAQGLVRLKLIGTCDGCPSSTMTLRTTIEEAIYDAAPDVTELVVEGVADIAPARHGRSRIIPLEDLRQPSDASVGAQGSGRR